MFEFGASVAAAPAAEPFEFPLGGCEPFGCPLALLLELLLAVGV